MPTITIDENRLEELINKSVQKHLETNLDDIEEVRRSPAGAIVRIETRLDAIEKNIEKNVATKSDLASLKTELSERIAKLETSLKLMFALLLSILALLIKSVFFS